MRRSASARFGLYNRAANHLPGPSTSDATPSATVRRENITAFSLVNAVGNSVIELLYQMIPHATAARNTKTLVHFVHDHKFFRIWATMFRWYQPQNGHGTGSQLFSSDS